jgi:hypothetical protein
MIVDLIKREAVLYRRITGHKPGRVYMGVKQQLELKQLCNEKGADYEACTTIDGMQIFKVNDRSHLYLSCDLEGGDGK